VNTASRVEAVDADAIPAFVDLHWDAEDRDDSWLVTYADIISTALAMVVLLFGRAAIAPVAPAVPAPAPAAVASAFAEPEPAPEVSTAVPDDAGPVAVAESTAAPDGVGTAAGADAPADLEAATAGRAGEAPEAAAAPPEAQLATLVSTRFAGRIAAERRSEGVVLTIPAVALFDSARVDLSPAALALLDELVTTLREVGEARISVEGHTDDRPVQGGAFRSNWDLAAARANAVTAHLLAQGFAPQRLHSVSYADTHPVADNGSAEGRAANRRVELAIDFETPRR